jgi:tetratricopeptide (TPR) repeat protein
MQAKIQLNDIAQLINNKKYEQAISDLHNYLLESQDDADALYLLSRAQYSIGNAALALENLSKSLLILPNRPGGNALMAKIHFSLKQIEQALFFCDAELKQTENNLDALVLKGYILATHYQKGDEAIEVLEKALSYKPSLHQAHAHMALALATAGRLDEAVKHGLKAIKIAPKEAAYHQNVGNIYLQLGNRNEAIKYLTKSCTLNPDFGQAFYNLSRVQNFTERDRQMIHRMENALGHAMPVISRQYFHFALGKAYDDLGECDNAFTNYCHGNRLVHTNYDKKKHNRIEKFIKRSYKPKISDKPQISSKHKQKPIFIVGMPRSGSTLIDQVLAAHPRVHSIGESSLLSNIAIKHSDTNIFTFPFGIQHINNKEKSFLANEYLAAISEGISNKITHIVNKQLENFVLLGLIASTFPNAKVIHAKRHPLDTCISCYFQNFEHIHDIAWSFNLSNIGHYYHRYHEIMKHWRHALSMQILDVQYEKMVDDFESSTRRILEFCELEWDPQVLDFDTQKRTVRTASLVQVREPIYTRSVARWRKYAKHLSPLVDSLGELLEFDREEIEKAGLTLKPRSRFSLRYFWK